MPKIQTPHVPAANAPVAIQIAPITTAVATLTRETRASQKCPRGAGQSSAAFNSKNSLLDLGDFQVDAIGVPSYVHTFMVDEVPLPAMDRVRPWREGRGGKVAESVGEALLLPTDMNHWAKWDDESILLNMKRETIMVTNFSLPPYCYFHLFFIISFILFLFYFLFLKHYLRYMAGISMFHGDRRKVPSCQG